MQNIHSHQDSRPALWPTDPAVRSSLLFLALFQLICWTALPMLVHVSPSLDIIESFSWGIEWQAGYLKHPPLSPWLIAASTALFGKNLFAVFILSPLAILAALFFIWMLSRQLFDEKTSTVGLFLVSSQFYFNLLTPEFNHNVMQIPLWAAAFALYWIAVTRGRLWHFMLLGAVLGLCVLAKYSAVLMYAALIGFTVCRPDIRRRLKFGNVLACVLVATAVAAPNIIWQIVNDFPSVKYAGDRMGETLSAFDRIKKAVKFLFAQMAIVSPLLITAYVAGRKSQADSAVAPAARAYIWTIVSVPLILCLLMVVVGGNTVRTMWGMPMFTAAGLAALLWMGPLGASRLFTRKWLLRWAVFSLIAMMLYATMVRFGPLWKKEVSRALYPGPAIAAHLEKDWRDRTGQPVHYVIGEVWAAGNVAFFAKDNPSVFIDGNRNASPWVDESQLKQCGALLVWKRDPDNPNAPGWLASYPDAQPVSSESFSVPGQPDLQETIDWTILPPQGQCNPAGK